MANLLLERAAHQRPLGTGRGALERLFTLMFQGFVYNQIWEDPSVDLEALQLAPHHRVLTIASGGCNILNYLAASEAQIIALDLNPNHVALTRLKLAALAHLPDHESFFRFFGMGADAANIALTLLSAATEALLVGPMLLGMSRPIHVLVPSVTARGVVNMTALAASQAAQTS